MASEDVKSGESPVTKIVTLAEKAKLASHEGVVTAAAAPSYAFTPSASPFSPVEPSEDFVDWFYGFEVVDYDAGSAATSREAFGGKGHLVGTPDELKSALSAFFSA
ncbi:Grave disease carrier protein [Arachis hypogaea]|uniref:Uncharacterized protein n=1 Tax=Arachis hypogaea TaxID=3818 RepID=A0A444ZY56_ARAHY|nr:Grave disease carrier protein [Arachis hypogaea]RYR19118.1 hypothetical protein Ahy_B03g063811 [Arachis hypogaea]